MKNGISRGLRLYPTLIRGCHAARAKGVHALRISDKMKEMCAVFYTPTKWDQSLECMEIVEFGSEENKVPASV